MKRTLLKKLLSLACALLAFSFGLIAQVSYVAAPQTKYVSVSGDDANDGNSSATAWRHLQYASNNAPAGSTINVAAGTYTEQVEISKTLTFIGAGSGSTNVVSPATLALSFTTSGRPNKPIIYIHDANGVVIQSLTVDGAGNGNSNIGLEGIAYRNAGGTVQSCEIKAIRNTPADGAQDGVAIYALADNGTARTLNITNNIIYDFQKNGTALKGANLTTNVTGNTVTGAGAISYIGQNGIQISAGATGSVTNNTISSFCYTPFTAVACGVLIIGASGSVTCSGNHVNDAQLAIDYYQAGGSILNNIIAYNAANMGGSPYWYAIDAEDGTTIVSGNEINNGGNGAGIEADYISGETTTMTVMNNKVDNTDEGVVIWTNGSGGTSTTQIHNNSITNAVSKFIDNQGTITQDATCNWYGTINYPVIASKISGPVTFIPYLSNGTDAQPATPGFQPVPGSCNGGPKKLYVDDNSKANDRFTIGGAVGNDATGDGTTAKPYRTINKAVSVANPGDSILVDAGTYPEYINVPVSLTFLGTNYDKPVNYQNPASCSGCRLPESVITAQVSSLSGEAGAVAFEVRMVGIGLNAVIKGFKIQSGRPLTDGHYQRTTTNDNDITILFEKNFVTNGDNLFCGTLTPWKTVTIKDNYFSLITQNPTSSAIQLNDANDGYAPVGSPPYSNSHAANITAVIDSNSINNTNAGGILLDNIGTAYVRYNNIMNVPGKAGIQLAGGMGNADVLYNTVSKVNTTAPANSSNDGGAIRIYDGNFTGTINIKNNLLSASGNCFAIKIGATISNPNLHVNRNSFAISSSISAGPGNYAIYDGGTHTNSTGSGSTPESNKFDAECNWFGSANAAVGIVPKIYDVSKVDYTPFLTSGSPNTTTYGQGFNTSQACGGLAQNRIGSTDIPISSSVKSVLPQTFKVAVLSNPAINNFTLQVQSPSNDPVQIRLVDISGKLISNYSKYSANSTITFGNNLFSGVYFAQIVQGTNHQIVKLVKLK